MENERETGVRLVVYKGLGFPKLGVCFWRVLIMRTLIYWGLYWGPPMHGNYHVLLCSLCGITVSTVTAMLTITTAGHLQVVL